MDSNKGGSEMQMDAGATSMVTAAGKRKTGQKPKTMKKAKTAEEQSVWKGGSTMEEKRPPAPVYKLTFSVNEKDLGVFNNMWMREWGHRICSMDQKTTASSLRITYDPAFPVEPVSTLQFFKVKITSKEPFGLVWPLQVYGFIAARDLVDYKRNIIFERERDNCQIIDEGSPYLSLTGPARAVALVDPVYFEVDLKVRGASQSEDYDLISLAESFDDIGPFNSSLFTCVYTSGISKLELTFGHIIMSVQAAVSMKVISGSLPIGFDAVLAARTASINDMAVLLLDTCDCDEPVDDYGVIKLQRHVVSAEIMDGEHLEVYGRVYGVGVELFDTVFFKPQVGRELSGTLTFDDLCEIEVTVTWYPVSW